MPRIVGVVVKLTREKMAAVVWSVETIGKLIELYEERSCLYNTKMKEYHDRDLRKKAMDEISTAMEISGE